MTFVRIWYRSGTGEIIGQEHRADELEKGAAAYEGAPPPAGIDPGSCESLVCDVADCAPPDAWEAQSVDLTQTPPRVRVDQAEAVKLIAERSQQPTTL